MPPAKALLGRAANLIRVLCGVCGAYGAALARLALHLIAADEVEHDVGGVAREVDHATAKIGPEILFDLVGIVFQPGIDLAAVASARAPAWLVRLQHRDLDAFLRQMQRRRQAGEAAADHGHIDLLVADERRRGDRPGAPSRRKCFREACSVNVVPLRLPSEPN